MPLFLIIFFITLQKINLITGQGDVLGSNCEYDDDCYIDHGYCYLQQTCECKHNFIPNEDQTNCIATIGAQCHTSHDCSSLKSSSCVFDQNNIGVCLCNHNFVSDPHSRECLPIVKNIGGDCIMDNQCQEGMGEASMCHRQKCECMPNHHYDKECIRNRGLGEGCKNNSQCYVGEEFKNTMECASSVCVCQYGFYNYGGYCKRGGANSLKSWSIFVLFGVCFSNKFFI